MAQYTSNRMNVDKVMSLGLYTDPNTHYRSTGHQTAAGICREKTVLQPCLTGSNIGLKNFICIKFTLNSLFCSK